MSPELKNINLDLEVEDLEKGTSKCCGTSTTLPFCTCPIRYTDCCAMVEYNDSKQS